MQLCIAIEAEPRLERIYTARKEVCRCKMEPSQIGLGWRALWRRFFTRRESE